MQGGNEWTNVTTTVGTPPLGRANAAFACDTTDANAGTCILTGGFTSPPGVYHSDTWSIVNGKWTNLSKVNPYGGVSSLGFSWDPVDHEFVELGGTISSGAFIATYATFNITTGWSTAAAVSVLGTNSVSNNVLAWDGALAKVVSIGGQFDVNNGGQDYSEPWTFAFSAGTWTNVTTSTGTIWGGFMSPWFASNGTVVAVFGGVHVVSGAAGTSLAKTWILGTTWAAASTAGGPPRGRADTMGAFAGQGTGILYGGFNYSAGSIAYVATDTWTYTFATATWSNITTNLSPSPPVIGAGVMAENSTGLVYMNGGQRVTPSTHDYNATWTFTLASGGGGIGAAGCGSSSPAASCAAAAIVLAAGLAFTVSIVIFMLYRRDPR